MIEGYGDCREFNYCSERGKCVRGRCECWPGLVDQNCTEAVTCLYWYATLALAPERGSSPLHDRIPPYTILGHCSASTPYHP